MTGEKPTRAAVSAAIDGIGWRLVLGTLHTCVRIGSWAEGARLTAAVGEMCDAEPEAARRLRFDLRADRALLQLEGGHTPQAGLGEIALAGRISTAIAGLGLVSQPELAGNPRSPQGIEFAIDALDIAGIRPFWKAALAYADEPGLTGPTDPLVDPLGQGPAVWFQQMDAPRPQRNRIHLDVSVPHEEAGARLAAVTAAGGILRYDAEAPAFWVFADAEGNEVCITTWQGRDG
jgi:4a-hydroxytetrahydrobiopterin dehydratase